MSKTRYNLDLVFANIFFGANFSFYVSLTRNYLDFQQIFMLQVLSGAIFFIPFALFSKQSFRIRWRDAGNILVVTMLIVYGWMYMLLWGSSYTSPIDASIVTTTLPIVTMIVAAIYLKEPVTNKKVLGIFVGAMGAFILIMSSQTTGAGNGSLIGDLLCLLAQISFSIYLTVFKGLSQKYSPITLNKWMFVYASMCYIPFSYHDVAAIQWSEISTAALLQAGYVVVGGSFLAYIFIMSAQRLLRPTVVSMYNYMQPIVASTVAIILGLGVFNLEKGIAIALVFLGVYIVTQSKSRKDFEKEGKAV